LFFAFTFAFASDLNVFSIFAFAFTLFVILNFLDDSVNNLGGLFNSLGVAS